MTTPNQRVTAYLVYLVFIVTLGPLQFGYHLVGQLLHLALAKY